MIELEFDLWKPSKWDRVLMKSAVMMADELSKCAAKKVACLLVKGTSIVSVGINGTPPGAPNCNKLFIKSDEGIWYKRITEAEYRYRKNGGNTSVGIVSKDGASYFAELCDQTAHYHWSLANEIHAESNALGDASRNGVKLEGASAYITHSPCRSCAKDLATHGIRNIYYLNEYDDIEEVKEFLKHFPDVRLIKMGVEDIA